MIKAIIKTSMALALLPTLPLALSQTLAQQCVTEMEQDSALNPIKGKVAFNVEDQSIEILANNNKPSPSEKEAISAWDKKRQDCNKRWSPSYSNSDRPSAISALENSYQATTQNLIADLYMGKLTYRQFAQKRKDLYSQTLSAYSKLADESNKQAQEASLRDRAVAAQEAQARASNRAARAMSDAQSTNMIVQGVNMMNSTNQPAAVTPSPAVPITCVQQGIYTTCR